MESDIYLRHGQEHKFREIWQANFGAAFFGILSETALGRVDQVTSGEFSDWPEHDRIKHTRENSSSFDHLNDISTRIAWYAEDEFDELAKEVNYSEQLKQWLLHNTWYGPNAFYAGEPKRNGEHMYRGVQKSMHDGIWSARGFSLNLLHSAYTESGLPNLRGIADDLDSDWMAELILTGSNTYTRFWEKAAIEYQGHSRWAEQQFAKHVLGYKKDRYQVFEDVDEGEPRGMKFRDEAEEALREFRREGNRKAKRAHDRWELEAKAEAEGKEVPEPENPNEGGFSPFHKGYSKVIDNKTSAGCPVRFGRVEFITDSHMQTELQAVFEGTSMEERAGRVVDFEVTPILLFTKLLSKKVRAYADHLEQAA